MQQQDRGSSSGGKIDKPGLISMTAEGAGEAGALLRDTQSDGLIDELVHEVTANEPTDQALPEKLSLVVNNILASGLNEQALTKCKQSVKRPENCNFFKLPRSIQKFGT